MKYSELTEVYEKLEKTSKRLDKTKVISEFLKKVPEDEMDIISLLIQGLIFPNYDDRKIGVAVRLVIKAINIATGIDAEKIENEWKKIGDIGEVAEKLTTKKTQATLFSQDITIKKVFDNLRVLPTLEGAGTVDRKVKLIAELLTSATPKEAKYIVRTVLEDMRVGVGEGTIRDSIVWAYFGDEIGIKYDKKENKVEFDKGRELYNEYVSALEEAYNMTNDFSKVVKLAKKGLKSLKTSSLEIKNPIKVMLFQKASGFEDAFERVGKPAAFEFKYDGFRLQIHKTNDEVKLFTRRLENVTKQFPDVVKLVDSNINVSDFIVDAEITGIDKKTGKYLPFQAISQRIKRKYDIDQIVKDVPILINIFDLMSAEGKNHLKTPFGERREILKKIVKEADKIVLSEQIITDSIEEAQKFYEKSLKLGNEGVMAKNLEAPYKPGSRVGYGVKIKPTMETLDLVIVGAEWGTGKRGNWLSSFDIACVDENGDFLEIGKFGTGVKEKAEEGTSFEELTEILKPLITKEEGKHVFVKAKIVVEIDYEEIQKSPTYSSGYALRFPRLVRLRVDKPVDEIADLDLIEELYFAQRGRK